MDRDVSADSYWPKDSHSFTRCLSRELKTKQRNGKTKDQTEGALYKRGGDMDVKGGKQNHFGPEKEANHGARRVRWKREDSTCCRWKG